MHPPREASGGGRLIIDKSKPATADFQAEAEICFNAIGRPAKATLGSHSLPELVEQLTESSLGPGKPSVESGH